MSRATSRFLPQIPPKKPEPAPFAIRSPMENLRWRLIRDEGRSEDVVVFEEAVVAFFLESADLLGVPKSVAAIYGICFASPYSMSFSDINDRLAISQGSVSQGLRFLREIGALKLAPPPPPEVLAASRRGPRRGDHYAPDMELRKVIMHFMNNRLDKQLKSGDARLKSIQNQVPTSGGPDTTKELSKRLEHLKAWHDKASAVVPVAKAFLKLA